MLGDSTATLIWCVWMGLTLWHSNTYTSYHYCGYAILTSNNNCKTWRPQPRQSVQSLGRHVNGSQYCEVLCIPVFHTSSCSEFEGSLQGNRTSSIFADEAVVFMDTVRCCFSTSVSFELHCTWSAVQPSRIACQTEVDYIPSILYHASILVQPYETMQMSYSTPSL